MVYLTEGQKLIDDLIKDTYIPPMARVRQNFPLPRVENIPDEIRSILKKTVFKSRIKPGMRIVLTAGSRGIANIAVIIREVCSILKEAGAYPFIVPAMGSHGGATAEGQKALIERYGITEEFCGAPIYSSMETVQIGATAQGQPVFLDKHAADADGIIIIGRVKAHTDFHGPYESGLTKMMVIGLGKQRGAEAFHATGCRYYAENLPLYGKVILEKAPVLFGLALIENACDETAEIVAVPAEHILDEEPALLLRAKSLMGKILFENIDLLIVDRIGKDISGEGMDANVTGRFATPYASGGSDAKTVCVLDLTDASHGAFVGIGMADMTTKRVLDKADFEASYINQLTSTIFLPSKFPIILPNDRMVIQACLKYCGKNNKQDPRVVRITDTMHLGEIQVSKAMLKDVENNQNLHLISPPEDMIFHDDGNLW